MDIDIVVYRSEKQWAMPWEQAFVDGLERHGITPDQRRESQRRYSDLAVTWAHRNHALFDMQRERGNDYLVMERGFIGDRNQWTSLGFNGLNGYAEFVEPGDDERFDRLFPGVMSETWHDGEYALVMGQVPGDASVEHVDIKQWARNQCRALQAMGYPVLYRPHPLSQDKGLSDVKVSRFSLLDDLEDAGLVVTFNSNSGVDAVLNGVPTVAMDRGSMAWDVASHTLDEPLYKGDREQWANRLAWCQWSMQEIQDGTAWEHLRQRYESRTAEPTHHHTEVHDDARQ